MSRFVTLAGYGGLLVCLDEMVNLYKLANTQARNANYEQILRILNDSLQGTAAHLGFVFGGTPDFLFDPRRGLYSYQALQSRLAENTFAGMGWSTTPARCCGHHAAAVGHRGIHERHVRLVTWTQIRVSERLRRFRCRRALAGQGGLVDVQRAGPDDPSIGGHVVSGAQEHQVTDHDLLGRDLRLRPVTAHPRDPLRQRLQRIHRALGLALLTKTRHGVEHGQRDQHGTRAQLADRERDNGGDEQSHLHVAAVLIHETAPSRNCLLGGERVGSIPLKPLGGLRRGEPAHSVDAGCPATSSGESAYHLVAAGFVLVEI